MCLKESGFLFLSWRLVWRCAWLLKLCAEIMVDLSSVFIQGLIFAPFILTFPLKIKESFSRSAPNVSPFPFSLENA